MLGVCLAGGVSAMNWEGDLRVVESDATHWVLEDLKTGSRYRLESVDSTRGALPALRAAERLHVQVRPMGGHGTTERPGRAAPETPSPRPQPLPRVQDDRAFYNA